MNSSDVDIANTGELSETKCKSLDDNEEAGVDDELDCDRYENPFEESGKWISKGKKIDE